ncbi:PREDICTED: ena/VASP-like protein [Nicotiana attenuata]|uniref:ena/VASP-like protein n=1 Tax=Nicotiana attenuata TaxID=49451 RepID=UPI0009047B27|nr:PREDICTED: ena/VASP-like protein [Nicotiana attenuata]
MTNPQDNLGTPPPVSPNTSSSTPPSGPPKPRFRRQKMLARKTVAYGSLRKVLNEKLQASQRKEVTTKECDSSSESEKFISAGEREEPGSSDTDKSQETPGEKKKGKVLAICGTGEEGGMKSGGNGSGEAAEGLINLSEQPDEPGSSVEETLADMLKKVEANHDPKKRKASSQRTPIASKPTKKSKVSSPKSAAPRGRAIRSRVRQSEQNCKRH